MIQITVDEQFEHAAKVYCKKIYDSFSKIEKEKLNLWVKDYLCLRLQTSDFVFYP